MSGPHPVMNPWMIMPAMLDTIQYSARPFSKFREKTANMPGMIHSIVRFVCSCCGLLAGIVETFCMSHVETPTSTGRKKGKVPALASWPRSIHRKRPLMGMASLTAWSQGYRCFDRSASLSGVEGNAARSTE